MKLWQRLWPVALWLLVSFGIAILLAGSLVGFQMLQNPLIDIQMHTTYFVMSRTVFIGWLLVPIAPVVGATMALLRRHSVRAHLALAVASALVSGIATSMASSLSTRTWTVYPPLDPEATMPNPMGGLYQSMLIGAYVLQFLSLLFLGYNCYRAGNLRAARKTENAGGA
jgi:hypothetical protein